MNNSYYKELTIVAYCVIGATVGYTLHLCVNTDLIASLTGPALLGLGLSMSKCDILSSIVDELKRSKRVAWKPQDGGFSQTTLVLSVYLRRVVYGKGEHYESKNNQVVGGLDSVPVYISILFQLVAYATPKTLALTGFIVLIAEILKNPLRIHQNSVFIGLAFGGIVFGLQLLNVISRNKPSELKIQWDKWEEKELISKAHRKMLEYACSLIANPRLVPSDPELRTIRVPVGNVAQNSIFCVSRIENSDNFSMKFTRLLVRVPMSTTMLAAEVLGLGSEKSVHLADLDPVAFARIRLERRNNKSVAYLFNDLIRFGSPQVPDTKSRKVVSSKS